MRLLLGSLVRWPHAHWDVLMAVVDSLSAFACVGDSHGRELRIGMAISSAFILDKNHILILQGNF